MVRLVALNVRKMPVKVDPLSLSLSRISSETKRSCSLSLLTRNKPPQIHQQGLKQERKPPLRLSRSSFRLKFRAGVMTQSRQRYHSLTYSTVRPYFFCYVLLLLYDSRAIFLTTDIIFYQDDWYKNQQEKETFFFFVHRPYNLERKMGTCIRFRVII